MVTYVELRDADAEAFTAAGRAYGVLAGQLAQAASILRLGVLAKLNGSWSGAGHDQAVASLTQRTANLTAAVDELVAAATTLQALGAAAAAAKARLLAALTTAERAGLLVDDNGVAQTQQPPGALLGATAGIDQQVQTAEEVTRQIAQAVAAATSADERAARELNRVAAAADLFRQGRLGIQQAQADLRQGESEAWQLVGPMTVALSRGADFGSGGAVGLEKWSQALDSDAGGADRPGVAARPRAARRQLRGGPAATPGRPGRSGSTRGGELGRGRGRQPPCPLLSLLAARRRCREASGRGSGGRSSDLHCRCHWRGRPWRGRAHYLSRNHRRDSRSRRYRRTIGGAGSLWRRRSRPCRCRDRRRCSACGVGSGEGCGGALESSGRNRACCRERGKYDRPRDLWRGELDLRSSPIRVEEVVVDAGWQDRWDDLASARLHWRFAADGALGGAAGVSHLEADAGQHLCTPASCDLGCRRKRLGDYPVLARGNSRRYRPYLGIGTRGGERLAQDPIARWPRASARHGDDPPWPAAHSHLAMEPAQVSRAPWATQSAWGAR